MEIVQLIKIRIKEIELNKKSNGTILIIDLKVEHLCILNTIVN